MDVHKNARTTPHSRALIAQRVAAGERPAAVARAVGVCNRTVHKWVTRAAEGTLALEDRSCRPQHSPRAISAGRMVEIQRLRQRRWTGAIIAEAVGLSRATVARTLAQLGLARLPAVEAAPVGRRYEWERPGQLVHVDAEVLSDEQSVTVAGFLRRAVAWFARRGVQAQRVLSDNGSAYRSRLVAAACQALTLDHRFTRPYTPRTNGKAERFIQTLLREWAYVIAYPSSAHRTAALSRWLHYYNWHRPHTALHRQPPISRVVARDDRLRLHS